jgi:DNA replication protein DnaC
VICICEKKKRMKKLFQSAMIPDVFEEATFENYQTRTPIQKEMKRLAQKYVMAFDQIRHTPRNSLGMIAKVGEWFISQHTKEEQAELKERYSNYGMGKTHLTIAIAKELLQKGVPVLVVNDKSVMEELSILRAHDSNRYQTLVKAMMDIDVLVWDDLGKSHPTDFKRGVYYEVINWRYIKRMPIIFSTNECLRGLDVKLGSDTFSRLMGMSDFLEVQGDDMRLMG